MSGWPSMTMTFHGDCLGVRAGGRPLTLRVTGFYRYTDGQIAANRVMPDHVVCFTQMGVGLQEFR